MRPFRIPRAKHARRHGPRGYADHGAYKPWLRDEFLYRCAYCLFRETWCQSSTSFHVDHLVSQTVANKTGRKHLITDYQNLYLACDSCNLSKKAKNLPITQCTVVLHHHVRMRQNGRIVGVTPEGDFYVDVLLLNTPERVGARLRWIAAWRAARSSTDQTVQASFRALFGFPNDLPNLANLNPAGNDKAAGVGLCCHALRASGTLPEVLDA